MTDTKRTHNEDAIERLVLKIEGLSSIEDQWPLNKHGCRDRAEHLRSICILTLAAFDEFVGDIGNRRLLPKVLLTLVHALIDAENGIDNEILKPRTLPHRAKFSSIVMKYRGRTAGVQDFLMAQPEKMKKEVAATFVFRALGDDAVDRLRAQNDRSTLSWQTVNRWRNEPVDEDQLDFWRHAREMTRSLLTEDFPEQSKERRAKAVLSGLRELILSDLKKFE